MNRKYTYPLIALVAALLIWLFTEKISNNHKPLEKKREEPAPSGDLSFSAQTAKTGILELKISIEDGDTPEKLDGTLTLIKYNENGTDGIAKEFNITGPSLTCEFLQPGKYRLEAVIGIPETEYDSLAKPVDIMILHNKTTTHNIVVPPD